MQSLYDRIIWAVIAAALSLIALNPWITPGAVKAQGGVVKVDIAEIGGTSVHSRSPVPPLPVMIVPR